MIEMIYGKIIKKDNYFIYLLFNKEITLKINILSKNITEFELNSSVNLFVHLDYNNFEFFGFNSSEEKNLFSNLLKISKIGTKTAIKILNNFTIDELLNIFKNYQLYKFIEKTKLKINISEEIFKYFHKNYFNNKFSNLDLKLLKVLIKLGYKHEYIYPLIIKNKKTINNSGHNFDFILQKIILDLGNLIC